MRTFLISLALLLITISLCLWSFVTVAGDTQALYALANGIPSPTAEADLGAPAVAEALSAVRTLWHAKRSFLAIGISESRLSEVERALVDAEAAASAGDPASFLSARANLLLSINRLRHLERSFL